MKNPFPDTIAFRAMALLVVGLAITHFVSNLFYTTDRETALLSAGGEHAIQWAATMGNVAETLSPGAWRDFIEQANNENRFVQLMQNPIVTKTASEGWHEATLQTELARHVALDEIKNYRISYITNDNLFNGPAAIRQYFASNDSNINEDFILVSLALGDNKWLNLGSSIAPPPPFFTVRLGLSMVVMLISVITISALIVGRMTEPLRELSRAAQKLGTDVQAPAIPETGPEEVRRTAHAFNVMQKRIRRFVEDRTQMLGAIAHDLGTPITRLRLRAEFVEEPELRSKMLQDLDDMQQMVASTLSFIREDAALEPQARVDIGSLLARVCDDITDAGFQVDLAEIPRWVLVDCYPVALRRALSNVIDNAVKYGRSAHVSAELDAMTLRILVKDNGPGIAPDRFEDVFRPFFRLEDSRNRETGGTGLGLSVARSILRGHGGEIRLKNHPQGGLCVELSIPLIQQTQPETAVEAGAIPSTCNEKRTTVTGERKTKWKTL
ncbi:MAG: ATP-binding protein [Rhodobacteraceae bacterium]|nr:ATP-binding protein [Paracoccaceae bacterium]